MRAKLGALEDRPSWPLILLLMLMISSSAFAIDSSLAVIPGIADAFGAESGVAQLTVTSYIIGYALGQIPFGLLADRVGRRNSALIGFAGFTVFGLVASLSADLNALVLARLAQGLFGASGQAIARTIARDIGGPNGSVRILSVLATTLGFVVILAPLVGAGAAELWGWRGPFWANFAFGLALLAGCFFILPETKPDQPQNVSLRTSVGRQLVASVVRFASKRNSRSALSAVSAVFFGYLMLVTVSSSVLHDVYGIGQRIYSLLFAVAASGHIIGGTASQMLSARVGALGVVRAGALLLAGVGFVFVIQFWMTMPPLWLLWLGVFFFVVGVGMIVPSTIALALAPLGQQAGFAAALLGTAQIFAGALGSIIGAHFYAGDEGVLTALLAISAVTTAACVGMGPFGLGRAAERSSFD